jgi:cytochrome P450
MALPPGPNTPPYLLMYRWLRRPLVTLEAAAREHEDGFTLRLPGAPPFIVFSRPAAVKEIFTADPEAMQAGQANAIFRSVLGESSILVLDGQRHLRERKLMMPPFHGERMRRYGALMREVTLQRMARWPRGAFPIQAEVQAITLDVILRAVFGVDEGELDEMRDAIIRWTSLGTSPIGTAFMLLVPPPRARGLRDLAFKRVAIAGRELPVGKLVPWARLSEAHARFAALLRAHIARRREEGTAGRDDVLSMLLDARDEDGQPMTDAQIEDEMRTLLVAGHETSATSLAWAVHLLCANPAHLARLRDEVGGAAGADPERLVANDWLDAVIKETLRMRPVVPLVGRVLKKPATIGGIDLPAGVMALASIYLTHRRPEVWPDPARFDPGRFVGGKKIDPYAYYPFGGGVRRCLGMAFANYEMKIVLGTILARRSLTAAPGPEVRVVRRGITFAPSGGMPVIAGEGTI